MFSAMTVEGEPGILGVSMLPDNGIPAYINT